MPIRHRILKLESLPDDPVMVDLVAAIWDRLDGLPGCPFCGCEVPESTWPWRYERHDIHGRPQTSSMPVCMGSRSVFTLKLLGLERAL
jgi:hypothetical protein